MPMIDAFRVRCTRYCRGDSTGELVIFVREHGQHKYWAAGKADVGSYSIVVKL